MPGYTTCYLLVAVPELPRSAVQPVDELLPGASSRFRPPREGERGPQGPSLVGTALRSPGHGGKQNPKTKSTCTGSLQEACWGAVKTGPPRLSRWSPSRKPPTRCYEPRAKSFQLINRFHLGAVTLVKNPIPAPRFLEQSFRLRLAERNYLMVVANLEPCESAGAASISERPS